MTEETIYGACTEPSVMRYLRAVAGSDAQDVAHDAYMRLSAAAKRNLFASESRLAAYAWTVIHNILHDRRRASWRIACGTAQQWPPVISDHNPTPEQALIAEDRWRIAHRALREIHPRHHELLVRVYLMEQPHEQIRVEMGFSSEGQFRVYKTRAKADFGRGAAKESLAFIELPNPNFRYYSCRSSANGQP